MAKRLTLSQFERLDGALSACHYADAALAREMAAGTLSIEAARAVPQAESRLYDVIISLIGYDAASSLPSLTEWAAQRVTSYLMAA